MVSSKLLPHTSIAVIIAVRKFQNFPIAASLLHTKLHSTVKCTSNSKTQKDHHSNEFFLTISSTVSLRVLEISELKQM